MSKFWEMFRTTFLAMITAGGVSYGTTTVNTPKYLIADATGVSAPAMLGVQPKEAPMFRTPTRSEQRKIDARWDGLTQKEIDTLTKLLKASGAPKSVTVFCVDDDSCGDIQLDFVNALGSAKWDFDMEKPVIDNTVGIGVSDANVASLIRTAIPRLPVTTIQANLHGGKIALVVGKKSLPR